MINPDPNPHVGAHEMVDRRRRFLRAIHTGSDEQPRIGSFATGFASVEPRPWDGKQMVGARGSGSAGAQPDEQPTFGSFASGLAKDDPRPWDGKQMVGARGSAAPYRDGSERLAAAPAAASQPTEEPEPRRDFLTLMGFKSRWSRAFGWAVVLLAIVFPFPYWG